MQPTKRTYVDPILILPTDLIGTQDAARILGITAASVTRRITAGNLKPLAKLDGARGAYVFDVNEVKREAAK